MTDSLWLVWRLRGPALAWNALTSLADRAAILLPDAVVAVCGGRTGATVSRFSPSLWLGASSPSSALTLRPHIIGAAPDLVAEGHPHARPRCEAPGRLRAVRVPAEVLPKVPGQLLSSAQVGPSPPLAGTQPLAPPQASLPASPAPGHPPQVPPFSGPTHRSRPQRQPATSLARVFLGRKAMLMRVLRVPTLAGHTRGGGVGRAPVALALPAEAIERRGFVARLCL